MILPTKEELAELLANQRAGRRGSPPVQNVLDVLPRSLLKEVIDDAEGILKFIGEKNR